MSITSSTYLVGIGPSGTSQLTVTLTVPSTDTGISTFISTVITTTITTMSSISLPPTSSTTSSAPAITSPSEPSAASRTPNIGAIVGGSVGGVVALVWILALIYFAHRNSCFRRPGYTRQTEERGGFGFGKRSSEITPTTESAGARPISHFGVVPKTFGEIRPSVYGGEAPAVGDQSRNTYSEPQRTFSEPPRATFGEPQQRTTYNDPPRTTFGPPPVPPPVPPKNNPTPRASTTFGDRDRPRSSFGDRPRSGFGDRPRSAFGDRRSPARRGFFGSGGRDTEWEGAGRRINVEPGAEDMEEQGGVLGWFSRAKDHAARRKRVKAEYEEDMKRMRGRSAVESDYTRY